MDVRSGEELCIELSVLQNGDISNYGGIAFHNQISRTREGCLCMERNTGGCSDDFKLSLWSSGADTDEAGVHNHNLICAVSVWVEPNVVICNIVSDYSFIPVCTDVQTRRSKVEILPSANGSTKSLAVVCSWYEVGIGNEGGAGHVELYAEGGIVTEEDVRVVHCIRCGHINCQPRSTGGLRVYVHACTIGILV